MCKVKKTKDSITVEIGSGQYKVIGTPVFLELIGGDKCQITFEVLLDNPPKLINQNKREKKGDL